MQFTARIAQQFAGLAACAILVGCASTTVTLQPAPQPPVCLASATALVVWAPSWRADQKDIPAREAAASAALKDFLAQSTCFAKSELRRANNLSPATVQAELGTTSDSVDKVVGIEVRELGPVVKLFSSVALVEGGTEVVLRVAEYSPQSGTEVRQFVVHWKNGGPGVVKGVASLPADMQSALQAALQPVSGAR
jgi:hypothetical protein